MKKILLCVIGISTLISTTYADPSTELNNCIRAMTVTTDDDNCSDISPNGSGSKYESSDGKIDVSVWYNSDRTLSGVVSTTIDGKVITAPIITANPQISTCIYGNIGINWNVPGFAGYITGDIHGGASVIRNVCAIINGKKTSTDFIFKNYI